MGGAINIARPALAMVAIPRFFAGVSNQVTEDDLAKAQTLVAKLYEMALRGNVAAAELFLDRVLGPGRSSAGMTDVIVTGRSAIIPGQTDQGTTDARPQASPTAITSTKAAERVRGV
jgi:hypothetical protein